MSEPLVENIENSKIKEFILDMGFTVFEPYPSWAYELAERMIWKGWVK